MAESTQPDEPTEPTGPDRPDEPTSSDGPTTESSSAGSIQLDTYRDDVTGQQRGGTHQREEFMIRPWPQQRARRTRWIALVLLVLAPLSATALTFWGVAGEDTTTVIEPQGKVDDAVLLVEATAVGLDLQRKEMSFRLVFRPSGDIVRGNELTSDVTVFVSDISGSGIREFPTGSTMEPTTVVVDLSGSQLRYPFDTYDADFGVGAAAGSGTEDPDPLALDLELGVALDQFDVGAVDRRQDNAVRVELTMERRMAVIIWVLFFMVLVWCIALGGAAVAWFIVVYAKDPPFWVFAFFASILFALPTLRAGLPGSPPYGSLVDWAAFYWSIAILAGALVALLAVWNIEARVKVREQGDAGAAQPPHDRPHGGSGGRPDQRA